jgi:hypothetical protein
MLGKGHFYHETIRKTVVAFGSIFNDIQIRRTDSSGSAIQSLKVPLSYGPKMKFLSRLYENPSFENQVQLTLPRMGFEITSFTYDASRKVNTMQRVRSVVDSNSVDYQYQSVPYNIDFSLFVFAKNQEDALQIVEQIIPFFTPQYSLTINAIPDMNIRQDFPVIMNNISYEDDYEGDFASRRSIVYTLDFTVKTNFYGPISRSGVIKKVQIDNYITDDVDSTVIDSRYEVEPDPTSAEPSDDFGFSETTTLLPENT